MASSDPKFKWIKNNEIREEKRPVFVPKPSMPKKTEIRTDRLEKRISQMEQKMQQLHTGTLSTKQLNKDMNRIDSQIRQIENLDQQHTEYTKRLDQAFHAFEKHLNRIDRI
ncbi:hypothetical protein [Bacillus massiliglaciei]|uniref:hypothetical protein n=1 Tax=Bacillus massiliglaciei TaxID=1816693 RepID=UPI000DA5F390|nr:hypothetical protein [Bacillus massiliglaciei]